MANYKISTKGDMVIIKSKLSFGEQINERDISIFEQQLLRGCFRPRLDGKKRLVYNAPSVIKLKKFLQRPLNSLEFFEIIVQTIEMIKKIEGAGLYLPNLILNIDYVFISEKTREVFYVYQPLVSRSVGGNIYSFAGETVRTMKKNHGNSLFFLQKFEDFLGVATNYRIEDMEAYIKSVCPQAYDRIMVANAGKSGFITTDRVAYANHYQDNQESMLGTTVLSAEIERTTLLQEEGTTLLVEEHYPYLIRIKTNEKKEIKSNGFMIGKDVNCDMVISDNKAVSRRHALISNKRGVYVIEDHNSTNGSYVNGKRLEVGKEETLHDGDNIRLADEELSFKE